MSLILVALTLGLPLLAVATRLGGLLLGWAFTLVLAPVVFTVVLVKDLARRRKAARVSSIQQAGRLV